MTETASPPGWYPDDTGRLQWWDGSAWTGTYADEQPQPIANKGGQVAAGMLGVVLIFALGIVELAWLGRSDRIWNLVGMMGGPLIGVGIGMTIGLNRKRRKQPKKRPLWWHGALSAVVLVAWLVFVAAQGGGLGGEVVVPLVALTAVGTVAMMVVTKLMTPEVVRD
jgi:hypothetical protein